MRRTVIAMAFAGLVAGQVPGAEAAAGVRIVRMKGTPPGWFTPEYAAAVVEAGAAGRPLPEGATVRTSSLAFLGIRPGQQIIITDNTDLTRAGSIALCTSNFVFTDGATPGVVSTTTSKRTQSGKGGGKGAKAASSGGLYIGTAGHCGNAGDHVFMIFAPLGVAYIGDIVKSSFSENRLAPDFALIAIRAEHNQWVSPSMAHWGGPTGAFTGDGVQPVVHSGHGLVMGAGGTPRAAVAYQWGDEWRFEGAIINGDSGSAANVATGLAAGNITHLALDTREDVPVWMGGTSISAILKLVGGPELATCALPVPWPAPGCPPV